MKMHHIFSCLLTLAGLLACTPREPQSPTAQAGAAEAASPKAAAAGNTDPFSGLLVDDAHLPWSFKHGAGPKPPESGFQKLLAFPKPPAPPAVQDPGPLEVRRMQPTGEVGATGALTVAFSQPMVPLASLQDTREQPIPAKMMPSVPGRWRWMGTNLLAFEAEKRFPFATHYVVTIPAGTQSRLGGKLAADAQFSFSTPPLALENSFPYSGDTHARPETLILLTFNQQIDPEKLLPFVQVSGKGTNVAVKPLSKTQFEQHEFVKKHGISWQEGRTLALLPEKPLEKDTPYIVTIGKGAPSAEGPRKTATDLVVSFKTYGPLHVRRVTCGWRDEPCRPGYEWEIEFSNPVETEPKDARKFFRISPSAEEVEIDIGGSYGSIRGNFKAATKYTLEIAGDLVDIFGQKLARPFAGTIQVADEFPRLELPAYQQAVLEASTSRTLPVPSVNIVNPARIRLFTIAPEKIFDALDAARDYYSNNSTAPGDRLGKPSAIWEMPLNRKRNQREITHIELDRALQKKNGVVFVEVKAPDLKATRYETEIYRQLLVNVTDIGLTARYDEKTIHVLVTGLSDGKPRPGVPVKAFVRTKDTVTATWSGATGPDGTLQIPGPETAGKFGPMLIVAGTENDLAFVVLDGSGNDGGYASSYSAYYTPPPPMRLRAHVFTERDPYRPGETVHITGWLRSETRGPAGKLGMLLYDKAELEWEIRNPQGESAAKGKAPLDKNGAFSVDYTPPADAMLGHYAFYGTVRGVAGIETQSIGRGFSVLAYRTPEHVVEVNIPPAPYVYGDPLIASISARYTFGAPMRNADANYTLRSQKTTWRPPKNGEFAFGKPPRYFWDCWHRNCGPQSVTLASKSGKLDDAGFWNLRLPIGMPGNAQEAEEPALLTLEADISDVNRQSISARATAIVHPSLVYTGLRTERNLLKEGEPFAVEGVVVDTEGRRIAGKSVRVRALLRTWKYVPPKKGEPADSDPWQSEEAEKASCTFTSAEKPSSCTLKIDKAGFYVLEGVSADDRGRRAVTQRYLYVAGKDAVSWRQENQEKLELVPDRDGAYNPGEKARILVQAPFYPAVGMLTVEREGIALHRLIQVNSSTHVEEIPITSEHVPNIHVSVALVRGRVKVARDSDDDPGRPLLAAGRVKIPVSLDSRKITVTLTPSKPVIKPGETIELTVQTTDDQKRPVPARIAVMAVDEGVLSLLGFATPDPMPAFYPERAAGTALEDLRALLLKKTALKPPAGADKLTRTLSPAPGAKAANGSGGGYRNGGGMPKTAAKMALAEAVPDMEMQSGADNSAIALRAFFATTAYFNNQVSTGVNGTAKLSIPMPENLTTFRIMAVAMDAQRPDRFGSSDAQVAIRKDFMLRAALPRFANYNDTFEAAVVLNTLMDKSGTAEVKISGSNFELLGPDTRTVTLDSRQSREIRFKVRTPMPGKAVFTFTGRFLNETDGVQAPAIPVHLPVTTETTATYGMTDQSVLQPVLPPRNVLPQFGGLDLHLSSTALVNLQDAVRFIVDTDWECSEAIASRLVPLFALRDVIPAFKIGSAADEEKLNELARAGIAKLLTYQHWNGGFRLFPSSRDAWSYVSAYVTWTLIRAREAGFAVPDRVFQEAARYLANVMRSNTREFEWYYSYTAQIYAAWVLTEIQRLKLFTPQQMDTWQLKGNLHRLFKVRSEVGFLARAWLMHALWRIESDSDRVKELAREIENAVVETASGVHFAEAVTEGAALLMHSQARTDAVILRIWMEMFPRHPLLWKIAKGLMDARIKGDWGSTQANAFVLDALSAYFRAMEAETPDFTVQAWYDRLYAGSRKFAGRSMDIVHARIPMKTLLEQGARRLLLGKEGPGKLYFRLGLAYVPADLKLPPESQGLYVKRSYSGMDNEDDVQLVAPGHWRVKAGATVRVAISLIAQDRRHFVALEDPFPAGFEGVDMQLKTSAQRPRPQTRGASIDGLSYAWWWYEPTHSEMRDDRFVAYYDLLHAGVYEYAYMARATTIGTFQAPPVRALEMYHPEVFGRGAGEIVEVVP